MQLLAIRNEGHGAQRGADDLLAAADQLSPPWARATQLVPWYRSSGRRGRLHLIRNRDAVQAVKLRACKCLFCVHF